MSLGPRDQARLGRILKLARDLELAWPQGDRQQQVRLAENPQYQELCREIADCRDAEAESLRRLHDRTVHLHDEVTLSHFYACIVPFERLSNRALRDDEFLVIEGDSREKALERLPMKLIAENLRSAFNVGALFRTAECLGVSEIWLCGYTPGPDDEKTSRTAMGTSTMVPWRRVDRARTACEELRKEGYTIVALETATNAVPLADFKFEGKPVAFVVGNERFGLDADTLQAVDAICRIPTRGIKNSMNVGVAFGIGAFEWLRQHEESRP
jgi:tRNA(Leu) C34 or U34 (ribose-2'-O)-methylase TrmL